MAITFPVGPTNGQIVTDPGTGQKYQWNSSVNAWVKVATAPSGVLTHEVITIAANGQILLTLVGVPFNSTTISVNVNGVDYYQPADFTVAANVLTWTGPILLETTDMVVATYI